MRNILLLSLNTLKVTFRKKSSVIVFIILPIVIFVVLMKLMISLDSSKLNTGVINRDNSIFSVDMMKYLEKTDKFQIVKSEDENINESISSGDLDFAFIIPEGFTESIYNGNPKTIKILSIKGREATAWIENYTKQYISNLMNIYTASKGDKSKFDRLYQGYKEGKFKIETQYVSDNSVNKEATSSSLGIFIMFMMISSSTAATIILKEKRNRTFNRVCTAPVTPKQYILSNFIANFSIALIQITLVIIFIEKVLKFETYVPAPIMIIILLCFGLTAIAIGMLITAFAKTTSNASIMASLITTPTCMLGGCFWPVNIMPETIRKVSYFMPQRWALDAISQIQNGKNFMAIGGNLIILLGFSAAFFLIAAYRMKISDSANNFV